MRLKEYYYEVVNEACPLSGLFPTGADFLQKCIYNHETEKFPEVPKFQNDPSSNCFTIDVLTFLLLFVSYFNQVLECFDYVIIWE